MKLDIPIINYVCLIIFNIGMGAMLGNMFTLGNGFYNIIWMIGAAVGNYALIKIKVTN